MGFFLLSGAAMVLPAHAGAPSLSALPSYAVTLTAYNAVPDQTDGSPFVTASGTYSNPEVVAARSQNLAKKLPFGTIIEIDGPSASNNSCGYGVVSPIIGYRVIADAMNTRYTDHIDVLFSTESDYAMSDGSVKNASMILGVCSGVTVRVVGFIDITKPSRLPKTQADLATLVKGGTEAQKQTWLPKLATAEVMPAVAVTEPDYGSDVAGIKVTATPTVGPNGEPGYAITGGLNFASEYGSGGQFVTLTAIPEPGSWLALGCLVGSGILLRSRRR